jgi:hypothetical protein
MAKRILIVYYTQTGQTLDIIRSLTKPFEGAGEIDLVFEAIRPLPEFPFPWNVKAFFQAMPESVQGRGCPIAPLAVQPGASFDLVILAWQAWFLSPSLPIQGFLQSPQGQALLRGRPVVTVTGSRNMWVMALEDVKRHLAAAGARHVGNIALRDKAPNLLSIFSIARWLFYNQKEKKGIIPRAGVSEKDIARCQDFGFTLQIVLQQGAWAQLQPVLVGQGAVEVLPDLVTLEKSGKRMFRLWSKFVLKKGGAGDPARQFRLKLFELYLYVVLFLFAPVSFVAFKLLAWLAPGRFQGIVRQYQATSAS